MGYTHYWNFTKNPKNIENGAKKFKDAVKLLREGIKKLPTEIPQFTWGMNDKGEWGCIEYGTLPLTLHGGFGKGEPIFNNDLVCFNGNAELKHHQETCLLKLDDDSYDFNFCKTARKPYDVAVCLTLLCFKDAFGDDFDFRSDGDIENGEEGWGLAKKIFADL